MLKILLFSSQIELIVLLFSKILILCVRIELFVPLPLIYFTSSRSITAIRTPTTNYFSPSRSITAIRTLTTKYFASSRSNSVNEEF